MPQSYKMTFLITLGLIFLAPLFFIPGGALSLASAKSALFSLLIVAAILVFLYETWRDGTISLPRNYLLVAAALLPVVYLLSSMLATPSSLSLLGYNLEIGTFGYMLLGASALILVAIIFSDVTRFLSALIALFASLSILALFMVVKILTGGSSLVLGNFGGNMGNPLGGWTDLAVVFGLLAVFATLAVGIIPMKRSIKIMLYGVFILATLLLVVINFSTAFALTLGASILLYLYFSKIEKHFLFSLSGDTGEKGFFSRATFLPIVLGVISLLFLINPTISETRGRLGDVVSGAFGVQNTDVRPTLSATLGISKSVLSQVALLGSGPNTFGQDWLIFKPASINATPFWGVAFPFGVGFIPTQIATTGILGTAIWIAFFVLLLILGVKILGGIPESRGARFVLISSLFISLFLWIASLLYAPSATVLLIAFLFAGLLVAIGRETGIISSRVFSLKETSQHRFVSIILLLLITLGAFYIGWVGTARTIAAYHFKKAADLSNTAGTPIQAVEDHLNTAVRFAPVDAHYTAISQLNFAKAQAAANAVTPNQSAGEADGTGQAGTSPEVQQKIFQESLSKAIQAARAAVGVNPASYSNWVSLGLIYSALVPEPLSVEGAYENAQFAYAEAYKRNPANPELPLLLAQLEVNKGNIDNARSYIRRSIALKEDYADAYLMLARLEIAQDNIPGAVASTEALAQLAPNNAGIHFELGVLKYSNKDYEGARASLARALELVPNYANAKYYLALSLSELGRTGEARQHLEELLATNPDSQPIKDAIKALGNNRSTAR